MENEHDKKMFPSTLIFSWWISLCVVALSNLVIMILYWPRLRDLSSSQYLVNALCFIYVAVCAFRSLLPRRDGLSICFFDTKLSTPLIGRTAATFAEVSFAILIAMVYSRVVRTLGTSATVEKAIWLIVPIICIAQCFCWYGITVSASGHIVEESLWTLCAIGLFLVLLSTCNNMNNTWPDHRKLVQSTLLVLLLYILFMVTIDIPMYVRSWLKQRDEVLPDVSSCAKISRSASDWEQEIPWMTGYFVFGSWSAMYLVYWYNERYL